MSVYTLYSCIFVVFAYLCLLASMYLLYLFICTHFCVPVFICSLFESLCFYYLVLLGTVCLKPNINFYIHISICINKNKSKIKSYIETSVGNEGGFCLSICCAKIITLCSDKVSKPGKRERLNSRDKSFAESNKKLRTLEQILKSNLYFSNKMWKAILLVF